MTFSLRTALALSALILTAPVLAACGDDDAAESMADKTMAAGTATTVSASEITEQAGKDRFIADYRKAMPKNAKNFPASSIVDVAGLACELADDKDQDAGEAKKKLSAKMEHNGIRPNDEAVIDIWRMAVRDTCPSKADTLADIL